MNTKSLIGMLKMVEKLAQKDYGIVPTVWNKRFKCSCGNVVTNKSRFCDQCGCRLRWGQVFLAYGTVDGKEVKTNEP